MKNNEFKLIDDYFNELKIESPSSAFEDQLMQQVTLEAKRKKRNQNALLTIAIGLIIASVLFGIYILVISVDWASFFSTFNSLNAKFNQVFKGVRINSSAIIIIAPLFILAIGDLLIRKHLSNKDKNKI